MGREFNPTTASDQDWKDLSESTLTLDENAVAIVTMIVDRTGIVRPLVVTKDQPEYVGDNLRINITNVMVQLCTILFKRGFRCGCKNCSSPEAEQAREAIKGVPPNWNNTKAQA